MPAKGYIGPASRYFRRFPFAFFLTWLLMFALIVQSARIFDNYISNASQISYIIQVVVELIYIFIAFIRGHVKALLIVFAILAYLILSHNTFIINTGVKYNFNSVFGYIHLLAFIVIYEAGISINRILSIIFKISSIYLIFYILDSQGVFGVLGPDYIGLLPSHDSSGMRLYLASSFASFVGFYSLRANTIGILTRIVMLSCSIVALVISDARTFLAIFAVVFVVTCIFNITRFTRYSILIPVVALVTMMLAGVLVDGWNPFNYMIWDDSAYYRAQEYSAALRVVRDHWLFGVGIPPDFKSYQAYLTPPHGIPLYASDLGALGPLVDFGLLGVVTFLAAVYFCITARVASDGTGEVEALQLNCITCGACGIISPMILIEPSSVFVALLMVAWLRQEKTGELHLIRRSPVIRGHSYPRMHLDGAAPASSDFFSSILDRLK